MFYTNSYPFHFPEVMWRTVNQAHRKSFPTCNIGKRRLKEDNTEKVMVDSAIVSKSRGIFTFS